MKRPDLKKGNTYDGWQVLDPTPQELSQGEHNFFLSKTLTNYKEFHRVWNSWLSLLFHLPQEHSVVVQPQSLQSSRERLTSSMMCPLSLLRSTLTLLTGRSVPVLRDVMRTLELAA